MMTIIAAAARKRQTKYPLVTALRNVYSRMMTSVSALSPPQVIAEMGREMRERTRGAGPSVEGLA